MFVHTLHFSVTLDVCEFAKLRVAVDGKTSHWAPAAKAAFLNFVIATREPSARVHPTSRMTYVGHLCRSTVSQFSREPALYGGG